MHERRCVCEGAASAMIDLLLLVALEKADVRGLRKGHKPSRGSQSMAVCRDAPLPRRPLETISLLTSTKDDQGGLPGIA